jgi:hypothetical protein
MGKFRDLVAGMLPATKVRRGSNSDNACQIESELIPLRRPCSAPPFSPTIAVTR